MGFKPRTPVSILSSIGKVFFLSSPYPLCTHKHYPLLRCPSPSSLQEPALPNPGQPLAKPLTRMEGEDPQKALDINKVVSATWAGLGWVTPPHPSPPVSLAFTHPACVCRCCGFFKMVPCSPGRS